MRESQVVASPNEQSKIRALELREDVLPYVSKSAHIKTGMSMHKQALAQKAKILALLGGNEHDWLNWKWHMKNRIKDASLLSQILNLTPLEIKQIQKVGELYRWAISPYYLSLIDSDYQNSPIFKQAVPDIRELQSGGVADPMGEEFTSPAPCITRRYPDRLIINVTNQCAMYCRHCQRRRNIGGVDQNASLGDIRAALAYVAENPEIRDVLITGGDALMLSDHNLELILKQLATIPHVEIKRIGTRVPVTLPQRITPQLCKILRRYPPIYLNTQFNHPVEVTPEAAQACARLIDAGVVLGNQAVLLRGINDNPAVMRKLNHELLRIRVRPYYIFHAKNVIGTKHWQTSIRQGLDIIRSLRGHTSGLAVPTYVYNAPGGLGKIPLAPNSIIHIEGDNFTLKTWEGKLVEVKDSDN
ncbi:MAG: KamA family radical SAM protein [Syntrophomonadaceae bacterium]|jgi:glutamate 2,3-aminomutase